MKKKIIQSTLILLLLSLIAKILSFIVRIALARVLSIEAMNYYSLSMPTMLFLITLAQMGLPAALSKVIASSKDYIKPLKASLIMALVNNILLTVFFIMFIPLFAHVVLKQDVLVPVLYAIVPMIPLVSLSGLMKGYFMGKQKIIPTAACQITEEVARIAFLYLAFLLNPSADPVYLAAMAMLSVSAGEIGSVIHMALLIPRNKKVLRQVSHLSSNVRKENFDEVLALCLPMTGSRLIGSLTSFLEPMALVLLTPAALQATLITTYGQLNGYILPLITLPSFATIALANWLLPTFTYHYSRNNIQDARRLFYVTMITCGIIGLSVSAALFFFPEVICQLLYKQTTMVPLLKKLALPFAFFALQPALSNILHAFGKSNHALVDTLTGSILRLFCISVLTIPFGKMALPLALMAGMLTTTLMHGWNVLRCLFQNK